MGFSPTIPELPAFDPAQGEPSREHGLYPTELPQVAPQQPDPKAVAQLEQAGWYLCPGRISNTGQPCGFWLNPQARQQIENTKGYFTCPRCHETHDLLETLPWHGPIDAEEHFAGMQHTKIGIPKEDQGQIGENLVAKLGELPGYGPITWWHPGGAASGSPLDGATKEWGIEVKTISYDALHHRFAPGGEFGRKTYEDKNDAAREMGLRGILGILVLLDYRRDVADIYVKEMPLEPWQTSPGRYTNGVAAFRKNTAQRLIAEVPFQSPYKDPANPAPGPYYAADYYDRPKPLDFNEQPTDMPF